MDKQYINPFNERYVTETIAPEQFVSLFSNQLVKHCLPVFQPGNIVVKGMQGSGKSMLLNLLKPEIRIAYAKAGARLPIPTVMSRFVGAGINFTRSVAIDFGQRPIESDGEQDAAQLPIYFGDFMNYWIVRDVLRSLSKLWHECDGSVARELGLDCSLDRLGEFANLISSDPCWFGWLADARSYDEVIWKLESRINWYRRYLNYNVESLPDDLRTTKTLIRVPISRTAECLWQAGVVPLDVPFFIRIDQYEVLSRLRPGSSDLGSQFYEVINKALGTRDPTVSFRIGTRRYGWRDDLVIYGTSARLELERDYKIVDIDAILRRKENSSTWSFPPFASDVFERRVIHAGYVDRHGPTLLLKSVLGDGPAPRERAERYASDRSTDPPYSDAELDDGWGQLLRSLWLEDPLSYQLARAWYLQNKRKTRELDRSLAVPPEPYPWQTRKYWRKERVQQALMQTAALRSQRLIWAGVDDVLALSGGNILVFVSICAEVWAAWIRAKYLEDRREPDTFAPKIADALQTMGIDSESAQWFEKIPEETDGRSADRARFVNEIARMFRTRLLRDESMSYPGHNGFSLTLEDLNEDDSVREFLENAVDYGALFDAPHTTRSRDRRQRRKWYFNPVLSPYYQLPVSHVKEPLYVTIDEVRGWFAKAGLAFIGRTSPKSMTPKTVPVEVRPAQLTLLD